MRVKRWPWYVFVLLLAAACNAGDDPAAGPAGAGAEEAEEEEEQDYVVFLSTPLADTLQGNAMFGLVVDADTGRETFVVELESGFDFAGGFFVAYGDDALPAVGTHDLVALSDSLKTVPPGRYAIVYRQGMLKDLVSRSGTVTFSTVNDTLIEGSFDALLHGFVAIGQRRLSNAEVHARGRFRATSGAPGYIIGL